MSKKNIKKEGKRSSKDFAKILSKMQRRGFVSEDDEYFEILKQEILRREEKEINKLDKQLKILARKKFNNKKEFMQFLLELFPNLPPYPLIS